ncbi:MAG TPA: glycoside hydrolase family 88 protein [Candidatus Dormibacteraeota bacterium]|jgi:unsaturated rhamnogalacturonyl hydrolase|nr:glycoside hydrolase family 88 protein [Candidatus Dormibacteraeota bacterium]
MKSISSPKSTCAATLAFLFAITALLSPACSAQVKEFSKWPVGKSPKEIGKRVAERFVVTPHTNFNRPAPPAHITYPETVAWYGALTFAQLSDDADLAARLIRRFAPLFAEESNLVPNPVNVDSSIFGAVPLEIYIQTKQQKYLDMGQAIADKQWIDPTPEGLTKQTRFWIDDMYMVTMVQLQAYRAANDAKYLDRAALEMSAYLDKLQQPNGLFYHAPDVPFFWGRGDGWVAAGMAEILRSLPTNHPQRARIMQAYRKMMESLLKFQGKDGMWRQLIDHPESWPESSCTAMFTFAMITGVKNGWLPKKSYARAARKGWLALTTYLDADANLREVCEGTNKKNDISYYLNRGRNTGDLHGQAPLLWCASALLR